MNTRTSTNFWLDVLSLVVIIGLAATGGLIHFVLPAGSGHFYELYGWNRHDIGQVHFYLAVAAVGLLALHVLLHWSWVCCVVGKAIGRETPSRRAQTTWGLVLLLGTAVFLVGGLWWASSMVQKTAPEGRGRGRRAHLEDMTSGEAATTARESEEPVAPPTTSPPSSASSVSRVGGIESPYLSAVASAGGRRASLASPVTRGDELGAFRIGSTVVLLWPPGAVELNPSLTVDGRELAGQAIGRLVR